MAMACLRLVTFLPERPLFSLPFFISCISVLTCLPAAAPYLWPDELFFAGDFFAEDFFAGDFFAEDFFAAVFVLDFFVAVFFVEDFLADFFAVAIG